MLATLEFFEAVDIEDGQDLFMYASRQLCLVRATYFFSIVM